MKTVQKHNIKSLLLVSLMSLLFLTTMQAQVKIGQDVAPTKGAVLELNSAIGADTYVGGLKLTNVFLSNITDLTKFSETPANLADLEGAIVYNTNPELINHLGLQTGVGVYYWDKTQWVKEAGGTIIPGPSIEPWYKLGTTTQSTLNTDHSYLNAIAVIGGDPALGSPTSAKVATIAQNWGGADARLTVLGGDVSFNGITVGRGGGQAETNTVVGKDVILYNGNSGYNTAIGNEVLKSFNNGNNNTAVGNQALTNFSGGSNNTILGSKAGDQLHGGNNNILIGAYARVPQDHQSNQLSIGNLIYATGIGDIANGGNYGVGNVGIGTGSPTVKLHVTAEAEGAGFRLQDGTEQAGYILTTVNGDGVGTWQNPKDIIGSGDEPWNQMGTTTPTTANTQDSYLMGKIATGATSAAIIHGDQAQLTVTGGDASVNDLTVGKGGGNIASNTVLGIEALDGYGQGGYNQTGTNNTAVGYQTLRSNKAGSQNTAVGHSALISNTSGNDNTAVGYYALDGNQSGSQNTAVGRSALQQGTGSQNTAVGAEALMWNKAAGNTAVGFQSLNTNAAGSNNVAIGKEALKVNNSGERNVVIGANALDKNTIGSDNVVMGYQALASNTLGSANIAIGTEALFNSNANPTEYEGANTAIGSRAGYNIPKNGSHNVILGNSAMGNHFGEVYTPNESAVMNYNTSIGDHSLFALKGGTDNIALGHGAGRQLVSGDENIIIGNAYSTEEAMLQEGSNNIHIGNYIKVEGGKTDNQLVIGNFIYGADGDTQANAKVGIGTNDPQAKLDIAGQIQIQGGAPQENYVLTAVNSSGLAEWRPGGNGGTSNSNPLRSFNPSFGESLNEKDAIEMLSTINVSPLPTPTFVGRPSTSVLDDSYLNAKLIVGNSVVSAISEYLVGKSLLAQFTVTGGDARFMGSTFTDKRATIGTLKHARLYNSATPTPKDTAWLTVAGDASINGITVGRGNETATSWGVSASGNVAVGASALKKNYSDYNVAVGDMALAENTSGRENTAVGHSALGLNETGGGNVAIGLDALQQNVSGDNNTAIGTYTLKYNTASSNTAVGYRALYENTTGSGNHAFGIQALENNKEGKANVAIGSNALRANNGDDNIAVGNSALGLNNGGDANIAVGNSALAANTNGYANIAVGNGTLSSVKGGRWNIGIGHQAGHSIGGDENVAIGLWAMGASGSADNLWYNTAIGSGTLENIRGEVDLNDGGSAMMRGTGQGNIAIGAKAGSRLTTGSRNILIGCEDAISIGGTVTDNWIDGKNNIAIGFRASTALYEGMSNQVIIGNPQTTDYQIFSASGWANYSDRRMKHDIKPIGQGLDFVSKLKPVEFLYNEGNGKKTLGFIAQDIQETMSQENMTGYNLIKVGEDKDQMLGLNAIELVPVLTKAIQEQQAQIELLQKVNEQLEARLKALEAAAK